MQFSSKTFIDFIENSNIDIINKYNELLSQLLDEKNKNKKLLEELNKEKIKNRKLNNKIIK